MNGASQPLRVLLLTETYQPELGGGERQAALLAQGLHRLGYRVTVLTRRSRQELAREETLDGVRIVRVGPAGPGRRRKWGLLVTALPALLRRARDCDVVLVSGFRILAVPALLARRLLGTPVVLKADSSGEMSGEYFHAGLARVGLAPSSVLVRAALALRNRLFRRADAFVAMGEQLRDELLAGGVPARSVHLIPNGVDTRVFRPASPEERSAFKARLGLPAGPVAIYTGRLVSYKGLPLLLGVWRELAREIESATLVLVGEGSGDMHNCEPALRDYVARHGLDARVRFTGAVGKVEDWLRAADAFVFPTENEAFGLALVEAMACGLPAVTTAVGGIRDFVTDRVNAIVIAPGDAAGLARGVRSLLCDPALAADLGQAARKSVVGRFGEESVAAAYARLFAGLVRERAQGKAA